jgi:phage terminase large subunit-like protein
MTIAEKYIQDVLDGVGLKIDEQAVPAGPWIIKAFQRHRRDLETAHERGLHFDPAAGQYVIDFCETFCIPSAQHTPMVLAPWQQAILHIIYGWKRADGYRRFRRVYLEIAKKNGKTGLSAALLLYHLIADGELSARCFVAATVMKQSRECFNEACAMVSKSPDLRALIQQSGNSPILALHVPETLSRVSPMARGSDTQDGAVVSFAIMDELHRWKTGDNLWSVLRYGGDTRKQPLLVCITTAGASAGKSSLCWAEHEYGCRVLDQQDEDDELCPFIFSLDPKDNYKDERNWVKANPSLGTLLNIETLRSQFKETEGKPFARGEYKRYRLNIWTDEAAEPAISIEDWDKCCREPLDKYPDAVRMRQEAEAELAERPCFAGLDLAPRHDTSALVLLFPPLSKGEKWRILEYFWCPEDDVAERVKRDRVRYDLWAEKKHIVLTPGRSTDVEYIADQILEIEKKFELRAGFFDRAYSGELVRKLVEKGFKVDKFSEYQNSPLKMNAPCIEFSRMVDRGDFSHCNNPVMRWQMLNLKWKATGGKESPFIMPRRGVKREKIDGCSSLIMGLACATSPDNQIKPKRNLWVVTG